MALQITGTQNDDTLNGDGKADTIKGLGGQDKIGGNGGDDLISGGRGNDSAEGGTGNDIIHGGGLPGTGNKSFLIKQDLAGAVTFMGETAGYRNTIGMYEIYADGSVSNVRVLFANASRTGSGGDLVPGVDAAPVDWKAGAKYGFFIVPDGYSRSAALLSGGGGFVLKSASGQPANVQGTETLALWHVDAATGAETRVNGAYGGQTFHSIGLQGQGMALNGDGVDHAFITVDAATGHLVISFEDLLNGGDRDFDDAVIRLDIGQKNAERLLGLDSRGYSDDDVLKGGSGNDTVNGGRGRDMLYGDSGNDTLSGGTGEDQLWGGNGQDTMAGNDGADSMWGENGNDAMAGGKGDDLLDGGNGKDALRGDSGDDRLEGGNGDDTLDGGTGDDTLDGGNGKDTLSGGSGDDRFHFSNGKDQYDGGSGTDLIDGSRADEGVSIDINNGPGNGANANRFISIENIAGSRFDDNLRGNHLANDITGGEGGDRIVGGRNSDRLTGGTGEDSFTYTSWVHLVGDSGKETSVDTITDFAAGDRLDFSELFAEHGKVIKVKGKPVELSASDLVRIEDRADGSHVSVLNLKTAQWHEAALLADAHGITVSGLWAAGDLVI